MVIISPRIDILWTTLSLLLLLDHGVTTLELLEMRVPAHVPLGTRAALSCRWQLGPADVLYSVKWYKDGKEFFRHVPGVVTPHMRFPLPGVDVEDSDSSGSKLVLAPATHETGGRYRCEVSGERPLFPTVSDHADMDVVALPEHGPTISGLHYKYRIGDRVNVNCSSGQSQPATQLSWYINGEPLPTEEYKSSYKSENALIVTSLVLDFEVTETHFKNGVLKVKCLATITPVYWKSNEESAVQEKHHDIGTINLNDRRTRAERVLANVANSFTSRFLANPLKSLSFFIVILARPFFKFLC